MLEIQIMSARAEEVWLNRNSYNLYSVPQSSPYIYGNLFLSSNIIIYFFFILLAPPLFINNLTRKVIAAELPAEIILGSNGSATEEYVLIFSVSPFSF